MQLAMFRFGSRVPSAWTAMAVIAALGLAVAQGIDGLLTATGLVFLDIALPVPLLGRWGVAVGFALVLQASAITADLMLANAPRLQRASRVLGAVLMAMLIWGAVQATAAFLHFAQLTNLTQGDQLTQALSYDVDLLVQRSAAAFARMRADYTAAVAAQRMLETQSRAGDDQSRIAACGPRCLSAIEVRRQLESRFAVLAATPPAAVPTAPAESASAAYARLAPVIDALRTRSALYAQMCGLLHAPTCPDAAGLVTADPAYLRLQQAMAGDQVANRQTLVLQQVGRDFAALRSGTVSVRSGALVVFVLLLPLCELWLVVSIRVALAAGGEAAAATDLAALRREDAMLDERLDLETRLAAKRSFQAAMERAEAAESGPSGDAAPHALAA